MVENTIRKRLKQKGCTLKIESERMSNSKVYKIVDANGKNICQFSSLEEVEQMILNDQE